MKAIKQLLIPILLTATLNIFATVPVVTSVDVPANDTYIVGEDLSFTVNWDIDVAITGTPYLEVTLATGGTVQADYASGTPGTAIVFTYQVSSGDEDTDGVTIGAIQLNSGSIKEDGGASDDANLTLNSIGSTANVNVDGIVPTVSSVGVPANDTYIVGEDLSFTVNWDDDVTITGTPYLEITLNTGGTVQADYASGSPGTAIVFTYQVSSGDEDTDGVDVGALQLNSGTILDGNDNIADLTLNSVGATGGVDVDGIIPVVSSVGVPSNDTYIVGEDLSFTVNWDDDVTITGSPYLEVTLNTGGTVQADYASGSPGTAIVFTYQVSNGDEDTDGVDVGALQLNSGTILDGNDNIADLTLNSVGATGSVDVDGVVPEITSVGVPSNDTYIVGETLSFTVNWDDDVTVTGSPYLEVVLATGGTVQAAYNSGSSTVTASVFEYTVVAGNEDTDGIALGSIQLNSGTIREDNDNNADLTLNSVGATGSVDVDGVVPEVSSVSVPSNDTYIIGETLSFTVNWDDDVSITGSPYLEVVLATGGTVQAAYNSGASTSTGSVFEYLILAGNEDANGVTVGALQLNSGTIRDANDNDADLTLNSIGSTANVDVDGIVPTVSSVGVPSNDTYIVGEDLNFTVNWEESVSVTGSPYLEVTLNTGGTVQADYASGSPGTAIVFTYQVSTGDLDTDGVVVGALQLNSGSITDIPGNNANLTLNSVGSTGSVDVDGIIPVVTSVGVPSVDTYIVAEDLNFTVNWDDDVTVTGSPYLEVTLNTGGTVQADYASGSPGTAIVFTYTVSNGDEDTDGVTVGSLQLNSGTIRDNNDNNVNLTLNSVGSTGSVDVDGVVPEVTSVTVPTNDTYIIGETLSFTVNWDDNVTVAGSPYLEVILNTGGTVEASYNSGSSTVTSLVFEYMVVAGDEDTDGVDVGALQLNSGTIRDGNDNNADLTLNSVGSTSNVDVDGVVPSVSSIDVPADDTYSVTDELDFTVHYDEVVTISGGTPYIPLTLNTPGAVQADYISGSGTTDLLFRYIVQVDDEDDNGISVTDAINLNGSTIRDAAANDADLTFTSGNTNGIKVDATQPEVTSVSVPSDGYYVSGESLGFTVTFEKKVNITGSPFIPITLSSGPVEAHYLSGSGNEAIVFSYTVQTDDLDLDGIVLGASIDLNGGTIKEKKNNAILFLNSVGSTAAVLVDAVDPTISNVNLPTNGYYIETDYLDITVNYSENVNITGSPEIDITFSTSAQTVQASYLSGSGTNSIVFRYTVVSGNLDNNGIAVAGAISLNGGSIKDAALNDAALALSFGSTAGILVDAVLPNVTGVSIISDNGNDSEFAKVGDRVTLSITSDEDIQSPTVLIAGLSADNVSGSGTSWTAYRDMTPGTTEGTVAISVSYVDLASNGGTTATASTDASLVTFYESAPSLNSVSIASDYAPHTDEAKTGSIITLDFTSLRELDDVTVTIAGNVVVPSTADNFSWTAVYTMTSGDIEGNIPFTIDFFDMPLNAGTQVTSTTDLSSVNFDKTLPELNAVSIESDNTHPEVVGVLGTVSLTITGSEPIELNPGDVKINALYNATLSGSGSNWTASYTFTGAEAPGVITFSIDFIDEAGNAGSPTVFATTDASTVTFDNIPPTLKTGLPDIHIESNNVNNTAYAKAGDVVTITFDANETIEDVELILEGKQTLVSTSDNISFTSEYTMPSTGIPEGALDFVVNFKDYAGNNATHSTGVSDGSKVTFDVSPPDAPLNLDLLDDYGQSATDDITSDNTPEIFGEAEAFSNVKIYSNIDGQVASVPATDTATFYATTSILSEGDHSITATATDYTGNISTISLALTITVDRSVPSTPGTPDMDAGSDTGLSDTDDVTNEDTLTFAGQAEANSRVYVSNDGSLLGFTQADIFGVWNYSATSGISEGVNNFTVEAMDLAGNISASSPAISVTIDYTAPTQPALPDLDAGSDSGSSNSDNNTNVETPLFRGTAEADATVKLYSSVDGLIGEGSSDGTWTITSSTMSEGTHSVYITATDKAGNVSPSSSALTVVIDITAPPVPFGLNLDDTSDSGSSTTDDNTNDDTPFIFGFAEAFSSIILYSNLEGGAIGTGTSDFFDLWTITSSALSHGVHGITATATDAAGNVSAISASLLVEIDLNAPAIPGTPDMDAGSDSGQSTVDDITGDNTPTFMGTAEVGAEITLYRDGFQIAQGTATGGSWTLTPIIALADGDHIITIDATDAAGNTSSLSDPLTIQIDISLPAQPGVPDLDPGSDSGNSNSDDSTSVSVPVFSGTAEAGSFLELFSDLDGSIGTQRTDLAGDWTLTSSAMSIGSHKITAIATDTAGNVSPVSDGLNLVIDNILPAQPSMPDLATLSDNGASSTDDITNDNTPEIIGIAEAYSYVEIYIDNVLDATVRSDGGGNYAYTFGSLTDATYSIRVICVDNAGNSSISSNILLVTIDTSLPTLTEVNLASNNAKNYLAKTGDDVELSFTASESIQDPVVTIDGKAIVLSGGPTAWTVTRTMDGSETEGNLGFSIAFTDIAGNVGTAISSTTDLSQVEFDMDSPDLNAIWTFSDHTNQDKSRVGSAVKINFIADEAIENVDVKMNGKVALLNNISGNNWQATSYMASEDPSGIVSFSIDFTDLAGNTGPQKTASTNGSEVEFDKTLPDFTSVTFYSNNDNPSYAVDGDTVFLEFTITEDIEDPTVFINGFTYDELTGGPTDWVAVRELQTGENEGVIPITINIIDLAGNSAATRFSTTDGTNVTFDDSNPGISSVTVTSGTYKVGDILPILIQTDDVSYIGETVEVNGKTQILNNELNTNYTIDYLVEENDVEHSDIASLPVNIVLKDPAGLTTSRATAVSIGGLLTIDSKTPLISTFASNAETAGNAIIGDQIIFTLEPTVAETGLNISPDTYNGKALNWSTADGSEYIGTYTVEEGDTEQPNPLQIGNVVLSDDAGNSDQLTYSLVNESIYANYPSVTIAGTITKCDYGQTVPITFQLTGTKPFELTYNNGSEDVGPITIDGSTYSINETEGTFTLVNLTDSTGNFVTSAEEDAIITVVSLPEVTTDYTNSPYNVDSPVDTLELYVLETNKRTGIFTSDAGIGFLEGKYLFDVNDVPPDLKDKDLEIVYTYTDPVTGCFTRDTNSVFVSSSPVGIQDLEAVYCEYDDEATIRGILPVQHTGVFEVRDSDSNPISSGWSVIDSVTMVINPQQFTAGTYTIIYTAIKLPEYQITEFKDVEEFTIEAVRTGIEFDGLELEYCYDTLALDIQIDINIDTEQGDLGLFFGSEIFEQPIIGAHNAIMDLSDAEEDSTYTLNYIFTSKNGCIADTISQDVFINPLPKLSFELDQNYNFEVGSIALAGSSSIELVSEGFTGNGVSRDTIFTAAASIKTPIIITYSGTDAKGCSNESMETTIIYRADETISGINEAGVYCFDEDLVLDISCIPDPAKGSGIVGTFRSQRGEIESAGDNEARYFGNRVGQGIDIIYFDYDVDGTSYTVKKEMFIDSVGQVYISTIEDFNYCHSEELKLLSGQWTGESYGLGGEGTFIYYGSGANPDTVRSSSTTINPPDEIPGTYSMNYTFLSASGCTSDTTVTIIIFPEPNVSFEIEETCPISGSDVHFTNLTDENGSVIQSWEWDLQDATMYDENPVYAFESENIKNISLMATTDSGCVVSFSKELVVGNFSEANFTWDNECNNGEIMNLLSTSQSTGLHENGHFTWYNGATKFGDDSIGAEVTFTDIGSYNISLVFESEAKCIDSIVKTITVQPYIRIVDDFEDKVYFEDFDSGNNLYNWQARGLNGTETTKWVLGGADEDALVIDTVSSGPNSWFTVLENTTEEDNSVVESPCFDLSGLEKPMIKMNIWSSSELKRDGAVLQYSIETDESGNIWNNLGTIGDGINWFNSENVTSQPGKEGEETQLEGWNEYEEPMTDWASARLGLDFLKGQRNVRFRFAYAANGDATDEVDGFAFDDVFIGERQQNVLMEYFTNSQVAAIEETDAYIRTFEKDLGSDIIPIHYHTSTEAGDPLNTDYTEGPSSRVFYYGVEQVPYGIANGSITTLLDNSAAKQSFERSTDVESLRDPKLDIDANVSTGAAVVTLTANEDLSGDNLIAYVAIVKDSVEVEGTQYYNVLRKFIPDPGGTSINSDEFEDGQSLSETIMLGLGSQPELAIGAHLVLFVQNTESGAVYQSVAVDLGALSVPSITDIGHLVDIYPNPANEVLFIDSNEEISELMILDITGKVLENIRPQMLRMSIALDSYKHGVYFVKGKTSSGVFTKKFLKQ